MAGAPVDERPVGRALCGLAVAALVDSNTALPAALRDAAPMFAFALGLLGVLLMSRHHQRRWLGFTVAHLVFMRAGPDRWRADGDERYAKSARDAEFGKEARLELCSVQRRELFIDGATSGILVE